MLWAGWFRISATPINRLSLTGANKAGRTDKGQQNDRVVRIIAGPEGWGGLGGGGWGGGGVNLRGGKCMTKLQACLVTAVVDGWGG